MPTFSNDVAAAKEAANANLVPDGNYDVTIFSAKYSEYGANGANAGRPMIQLQYRISDGPQKNRRIFENVGLFGKWAPTAKNPDGFPNRSYATLAKAIGVDISTPEVNWPSEAELGGLPLKIRVGHQYSDFRGEDQNTVSNHQPGETKDFAVDGGANVLGALGGVEVGDSAPVPKDSPWSIS